MRSAAVGEHRTGEHRTLGVLGEGSRERMHCERQGGDTKARRAPSAPTRAQRRSYWPQGGPQAKARSAGRREGVSRPKGGTAGSPTGVRLAGLARLNAKRESPTRSRRRRGTPRGERWI